MLEVTIQDKTQEPSTGRNKTARLPHPSSISKCIQPRSQLRCPCLPVSIPKKLHSGGKHPMALSAPSANAGSQLLHKAKPLASAPLNGEWRTLLMPRHSRNECGRAVSANLRVAAAAKVSTKTEGSVQSYDISPGNGSAFGTGSGNFFKGTETVGVAMTSMVVVATPETMLGDILEHFAFYTGLPVADERTNHLVGMITNIDMYKKQRGKATSVANTQVREVMTSPVVAVYPHTLVSYAAGLMLKYKVHRLPVVDREFRVVGIVTRKDLFQTLTASQFPDTESFTMVP